MVEMRFTMAIVFISFTYLYLDCFQDDVLAVADDSGIKAGDACKATVTAEVVSQGKNKKIVVLKYKAKKGYRRKNGHRQPYTRVRITAINV